MAHERVDRVIDKTGLSPRALEQIAAVLRRWPQVTRVRLFGSRAKGTARPNSDIDLALDGDLDDLTVQRIALALDELPLPYLFDVKAVSSLNNRALLEHIERVGIEIYPKTPYREKSSS
ncbi:nucleotidyltransferase family protein [Hydrogenophilus islandicus]